MGDWCSEETTTEKIREAAEKLEIADCEKTRHTLARERFKVPLIGEVYSLTEGLLMGDPFSSSSLGGDGSWESGGGNCGGWVALRPRATRKTPIAMQARVRT
jgi:hypothetical protein